MPHVPIDGVNIYYESVGTGPPLVLAAGLGGNTTRWAAQVPVFSQRYRFITWDQRGHGRSDSPPRRDQYGLQVSVEDLRTLLDHLEIEEAFVGGTSMGGGVAARFAVAHTRRVAALIIADSATASGLPMSPSMRAMRERTIQLAETQGMAAIAEYCFRANPNVMSRARSSDDAAQALKDMFLGLNPTGYANTVRAMIESDFPTERLSEITAPTLIIAGELDPAHEAALLTHAKIQGSEFVVIPGAGHMSNLDSPNEFNSSVLEFLERVEAGARV